MIWNVLIGHKAITHDNKNLPGTGQSLYNAMFRTNRIGLLVSESLYKGIIFYINYRKISMWEPTWLCYKQNGLLTSKEAEVYSL